jgi:hypothetical protein
MDENIESRISEIEEQQARFRLATDGTDGWVNWIESRMLQERRFEHELIGQVMAQLRNEFEATARRIVDKTTTRHVRGTFNAKSTYVQGDVVALEGGSFIARRDDPGGCPGAGWQLIAKQGQRGIAGEKGEKGRDAPHIVRWDLDYEAYTATPILDGGGRGPPLELRGMFQAFLTETKI